jgi:exopolyphosphatase/pppGpp-phosphohydrolase
LPVTHGADTILCTGGTAVSLAVILNYMRRIGSLFRERESISKGDLERMLRRLWGLFETGRQHRLPLEKERLNLLLPGTILLTLLLREMRVPVFLVTSRDIRWGGIIAGDRLTEYSIDGRSDR